jgi:hypothetical protein
MRLRIPSNLNEMTSPQGMQAYDGTNLIRTPCQTNGNAFPQLLACSSQRRLSNTMHMAHHS